MMAKVSSNNKLQDIYLKVLDKASIQHYHLKKHMREFSQYIGHSQLILDVGCGKSPYKSLFSFEGYYSVDIDNTSGADLIADICNLPIKRNVADMVICTEVLEHVNDTNIAVRELSQVLKNNGFLVVCAPLLIGVHDDKDFVRFTEVKLRELLEKNGFEVLVLKKRGGILSSINFMMYQVPYQVLNLTKAPYLAYAFMFISQILFVPLTRISIALDTLDRKKDFTLGYSALCRKAKGEY